jgi:hypothetical protein
MINFKEAIKASQNFAAEIFPPADLKGLRVEALNQSDDGRHWYVTLGWVASDTRVINPPGGLLAPARLELVEAPRVYKKFKIDADSGNVLSMTEGG